MTCIVIILMNRGNILKWIIFSTNRLLKMFLEQNKVNKDFFVHVNELSEWASTGI
jgi:hypothetical protein